MSERTGSGGTREFTEHHILPGVGRTDEHAHVSALTHTRPTRRVINHYYLGVIFLRYNFVCLPPRVGARACTPRRAGRGTVSKSGAGPSIRSTPVSWSSSSFLFFFFFFFFFVCFFTARELTTSTPCVHMPAASLVPTRVPPDIGDCHVP